jgi:hypothetical protein
MDDPAVPIPDIDDDDAELRARAVAAARADDREVPHEEMRAWLLKLAAGDLSAEPPKARKL